MKPYTRADWNQILEEIRPKTVHFGGYFEEGVRSVFFWAGPDNHPDNWRDEWEFFYGDKDLYPEKRAFIGWVSAAGWAREEDDGFDYFEIRTRNIQAIKAHRNTRDWQTTKIRSRLINRPEDVEWVRELFLDLHREVFPDREDPRLEVSSAEFDVPESFPSYLQPSRYLDGE